MAECHPDRGIIRGRSPLIELMSARRADINSFEQRSDNKALWPYRLPLREVSLIRHNVCSLLISPLRQKERRRALHCGEYFSLALIFPHFRLLLPRSDNYGKLGPRRRRVLHLMIWCRREERERQRPYSACGIVFKFHMFHMKNVLETPHHPD